MKIPMFNPSSLSCLSVLECNSTQRDGEKIACRLHNSTRSEGRTQNTVTLGPAFVRVPGHVSSNRYEGPGSPEVSPVSTFQV